jgi:hypothetical protein
MRRMVEIEVFDLGRPRPTFSSVLFNFRFLAIFRKNRKDMKDFVKNHGKIESADIRWEALVASPLLYTRV